MFKGPTFIKKNIHDIFYFFHKSGDYYFENDNTILYADNDIDKLINSLENKSKILIISSSLNKMLVKN